MASLAVANLAWREPSGLQPGARSPAPGDLVLVQSFINSHYDLEVEHGADLFATPAALTDWFSRRGLLAGTEAEICLTHNDLHRALMVREGLRALARADGEPEQSGVADPLAGLNDAARGAAFEVRFADRGPRFVASAAAGLDRALGIVLAILAVAMIDGSWARLKVCPGEDCGWAFYDHSRNQSGRWCSMTVCGGAGEGTWLCPTPPRRRRVTCGSRHLCCWSPRGRGGGRDGGCCRRWGSRSRWRSPWASRPRARSAGDQSARSALGGLSPLDRSVRVTWQGVVTPGVARQASALLRELEPGVQTEVVLLNAVRLGGVVVRPAAIEPLDRWLPSPDASRLGPCRAAGCRMLLAGGGLVPSTLAAIGVRIHVVASAALSSAVPLGFSPVSGGAQPVLVTGDVAGLEALAGLSGVYRTRSWIASLPVARLHSWQLKSMEGRLARAQAGLVAAGTQFSLAAPFTGLDEARAQASAAPRRLLLAGGAAIAALALFILLAGSDLRRDQLAELERLRNAGARTGQGVLFVVAESGWMCAVALGAGAGLGIVAAALLAHAAGEPVGGVLTHSVITLAGAVALAGGWLAATSLASLSVLTRSDRVVDVLAIAAVSALGLGLILNTGGNDTLAVLVAPLCCLAAGVLTYRAAAGLLRAAERLARRGPVLVRLALVGLARAPALPSLAIAFVAVSIGLGGFALAYRATLLRGVADQAADQVPLDAIVSPGQDFRTPLELAPLARWRALASGTVWTVRRTDANYASGGGTVTVPALGIPGGALPLIHGWRTSDGSAPLTLLARRLRPPGPVRLPGPVLPAGARWLSLRSASPALDVAVTADLRDPQGAIRQAALGTAGARAAVLRARLPPGRWELEAFELDEPTGLAITDGHQNGENAGAATQFLARVALGPVQALAGDGRPLMTTDVGGWRAVGAAGPVRRQSRGTVAVVSLATSGHARSACGPPNRATRARCRCSPTRRAVAASGPEGRLALTVDGLPVVAARGRHPAPIPDPGGGRWGIRDRRRGNAFLGARRAAPRTGPCR